MNRYQNDVGVLVPNVMLPANALSEQLAAEWELHMQKKLIAMVFVLLTLTGQTKWLSLTAKILNT